MKPKARMILSVVVVIAGLIVAVGGAYALSLYAIAASQHKWCDTLELLTSNPPPKPADPKQDVSRERAYTFYVHLKTLEGRFGC